jgi:hypothetical protein
MLVLRARVTQMTQTQVDELARALERAHARGVVITGTGTRKSDGARIIAVTSSRTPARWHLVAVVGNRLCCDCEAAKYGRICVHRAVAHERLVAERADREAQAASAQVRDTAILVGPNGNRAFSIFKQ